MSQYIPAVTVDRYKSEGPTVPPITTPATMELVPLSHMHRVLMFDPSGGGKSAKSLNAIVVAGMDSASRIFVLRVWAANCGLGQAVHNWQLINDQFRCHQNRFEAVGAYKGIEDLVKETQAHEGCRYCNRTHLKFTAIPTRPEGGSRGQMSKEERIRVYSQKALEERRVYLRPGMVSLINQVGSFGVNAQIDELDALAYCIHYLRPPDSYDNIETMKADLEMRRAIQVSRIDTEYSYGGYI